MGEYPRLAAFALDTDDFCAKILKMPQTQEMSMNYHDDEWIDLDDGMSEEGYYDEECYVEDDYYDDSMDGDFDSAMRDAGFGTDEDYGYYGEDY